MPPTRVVSPNVLRLRELCGTAEDIRNLAERSGRHPSTVRSALRGRPVSLHVIRDFARAAEVSEEELIGADPQLAAIEDCTVTIAHTHTPEYVAALLPGVSARTLRNRASQGQIAYTQVGREIGFTHEQIEKLVADAAREPAPPRRDSRRRS
ncbi:helix-turn-helix domain-containing protein [Thermomonospora cellulosilytica]|uniref:Helix-turn-helix domain-containing protein n=1 Tax=Thermomonospora cellulosilytica TaxID=1411118 RepID=A0A7W3RB72_9ACTN|nr:helix-turn-helix domain-containing protein [Thermomonospora cellulosilytica]MBA9006015.1 hypothetical protein [Thermomonospora cellulosilytica]